MLSEIILRVLLVMFSVVQEDLPNSQMGNIFWSCGPHCIASGCLPASHRIVYSVSCVQTVLCFSCSNVVSANAPLSLRICIKLENVCLEFCDREIQLFLAVSSPCTRPNMNMYSPLVFSTHWTCATPLKSHV